MIGRAHRRQGRRRTPQALSSARLPSHVPRARSLDGAIRGQQTRAELIRSVPSPTSSSACCISGTIKQQIHAAAEALHRVRRIWLVGTGTSQHAAHLGAAMMQDAGRSAHAVSSMQFVKNAPIVGPHDGVVVITHTGETAYALAARALAFTAGLQTVTISREGLGMNDMIETVPKETSETYTVSYTSALLVIGMIAHRRWAPTRSPPRRSRPCPRRCATRSRRRASTASRCPASLAPDHRRRPCCRHGPRGRAEGPRGGPGARRGLRRRVPPARDRRAARRGRSRR